MPKRTDIESILIIGSGPIVIGQACEFDYSGTQACKVLREEGYRVILINSNPATIMTDPDLADATYIEPITPAVMRRLSPKGNLLCSQHAGFSRTVLFLLVLLTSMAHTVLANTGSGMAFAGIIQLLIGNFIIGFVEAFFVRKVFKIAVSYWIIVLSNYVSMFLGYVFIIAWFAPWEFTSLSSLPKALVIFFVSSVCIEWPFFAWAMKDRIFGFSRSSFKYAFSAQFLSYALLVPLYFTTFDEGRRPPGEFMSRDLHDLAREAREYRRHPVSEGGGGGSYDDFSIPKELSVGAFASYEAMSSKDSIVFFAVWTDDSATVLSVVLDSTGKMHLLRFTGDPSRLWLD